MQFYYLSNSQNSLAVDLGNLPLNLQHQNLQTTLVDAATFFVKQIIHHDKMSDFKKSIKLLLSILLQKLINSHSPKSTSSLVPELAKSVLHFSMALAGPCLFYKTFQREFKTLTVTSFFRFLLLSPTQKDNFRDNPQEFHYDIQDLILSQNSETLQSVSVQLFNKLISFIDGALNQFVTLVIEAVGNLKQPQPGELVFGLYSRVQILQIVVVALAASSESLLQRKDLLLKLWAELWKNRDLFILGGEITRTLFFHFVNTQLQFLHAEGKQFFDDLVDASLDHIHHESSLGYVCHEILENYVQNYFPREAQSRQRQI